MQAGKSFPNRLRLGEWTGCHDYFLIVAGEVGCQGSAAKPHSDFFTHNLQPKIRNTSLLKIKKHFFLSSLAFFYSGVIVLLHCHFSRKSLQILRFPEQERGEMQG